MNIEQLRGLPQTEAIAKAAEWAGVGPEVIDGIWNTETKRGSHPTLIGPTTKWGEAKGPFQQLDYITDTWSQRFGKKLDPMDFYDGLAMTAAQLKENMTRYGDVRKSVMAYHGGTNEKQWGAKTRAYADNVLGKGLADALDIDPMTTSATAVKAAYEARPAAPAVGGGSLRAASDFLGASTSGYAPALQAQRQDFEDAERKVEADKEALAEGTGFVDQVSASLRLSLTPANRMIARVLGSAPERGERDEEWLQNYARNWTKMESGFTEEEREKLRDTVNDKDYQLAIMDIMTQREDNKIVGARGAGWAMAASVTGGLLDYQNYLTGYGVFKAMGAAGIGSARLIAQGRAGAAAASVAAENVAANVAYEGLLDALGEYRGTGDYAIAAATGLLPSALFSTMAYREASQQFTDGIKSKVLAEVLDSETRIATQAIANLGEGAERRAIVEEMRRIETAEISAKVRGALAPAADEDIIPAINLDEVAGDALPTSGSDSDMSAGPRGWGSVEPQAVGAPPPLRPDASVQEREVWHDTNLKRFDDSLSLKHVQSLDAGVHLSPALRNDPVFNELMEVLGPLHREMLPNERLLIVEAVPERLPSGEVGVPNGSWKDITGNRSYVSINRSLPREKQMTTMLHEFGHAIENRMLSEVSPQVRAGVEQFMDEWFLGHMQVGKAGTALAKRGPISRLENEKFSMDESLADKWAMQGGERWASYMARSKELMAEQFAKYVEAGAAGQGGGADLPIHKKMLDTILKMFDRIAELFQRALKAKVLAPDTRIDAFYADVRRIAAESREVTERMNAIMGGGAPSLSVPVGGFKGPQMMQPAAPRIPAADWQLATKYGLDKMPQTSPMEKAEFKAVLDLYRKAEVWAANNPVDEGRLQTLLNNSTFQSLTSTSMMLAMSQNPVARMVAGTLLENTTGAVGRRSTAALSKFMHEQAFIGNTLNEYEAAFGSWAKANGHNSVKAKVDNLLGGDLYPAFNKQVSEEIEARRGTSQPTGAHPAVQRAADAIEQSYERMRVAQVQTKTVGFARLPESSRGYMTHVISKERVMSMTDSEQRAFINLLTEQFQQYEGFDLPFSQELARKYLDHARVNALGGHEIPANIHNPQSADMVKGALEAMGMNKEQVNLMMAKFASGGPSHTKKRLDINLNQPYPDGMGGEVRLLDLFETDQLQILRNYSRRVSGEVALAQHGVMGSQGLALLRRALMFGDHGPRVEQPRVMEAFDQIGAEFLGRPFGDNNNKWLDRAMTANAAARLGGMVFNQVGEAINMFTHLGVSHALSGIGSMPRLRGELVAAAKGQPVKNGILSSLEQWGGTGEFGSEGYKLVMPFDEPNGAYRSYGADTVTTLDRVLRSAGHAQGVLSGWRMVHAAQTRAAAEQIVLKSVRYVRDGIEDSALRDMGITPQMAARIKKELPNVATFDAAGRVQSLDFTKAVDQELARDWAQVVLRGSRQIIQGTFIGEQGKWAHDGWLKLLTQFRTFSLTSMEKQWARGRENRGGGFKGTFAMLGVMTGAMAAVLPIYYARVMISAEGRPDREEYIRDRMNPVAATRAVLNYIPMSGLLGDFLDASSAVGGGAYEGVSGEKLPAWAQASGGRAGGGQAFVGGVVAPAASYVDDAYKALQDLDNPHKAVQMLPGSRIWWLQPAINGLRPE